MPNTPTYILYHGRGTGKDKQGKKIWTRIGAVWPNKSGKGFNLSWDTSPWGTASPSCFRMILYFPVTAGVMQRVAGHRGEA